MRNAFAGLLTLLAAAVCLAQSGSSPAALKTRSEISWTAPGSMPPGAEYHLIHEDPKTHAIAALVRYRAGYVLPPHSHTHAEFVMVVKGKLGVTIGSEQTVLTPGAYAKIPGGLTHALKAKGWGACEFYMSMDGPFDLKGLSEKAKP